MADDKIPRAPAPQRAWRTPASSSYQPTTKTSRWRTIWLFCLLLAAVGGAVVAIAFYVKPPPAPYFLALTFSEYHSTIVPYNAFAAQDGEALRSCLGGKDAFTRQERQLFINELNNLQRRTDRTVVVYLRAYAVARMDRVLILPAEEDEATWYPLAEVLEAIHRCPSKNKLLLLDLMRPVADARLGVLADHVAAHVDKMLESPTDASLQVMCACSPGQVSLVAPGFQQSVFGYYLKQGLLGAADGYNPNGERNNSISVNELAAFVHARADRWASHRNTRQTPILRGTPNDFALTSYQDPPPPMACELLSPFDESEWKLHDAWRESEAGRKPSEDLRLLQAELLRAEQHRAGGKKISATFDGFRKLSNPKAPSNKQPAGQAVSSSEANTPGKEGASTTKPPEAPGANFREKLKRALEKMQIKDQAVEVKDDKAKPGGDPKPDKDVEDAVTEAKKKLEADRDGFVQDLVTVLALEPRANPLVLKWLGDMVESWPSQPPPRGIQLLRDLTRPPSVLLRLDNRYWKGQAAEKAVQRAFEAVRRADEIDALEEETRRWIQPDVSTARAKYDDGLKRLCKSAGDGNARATAANELGEAVAAYERAIHIGRDVSKAQRTCNDALAFLPDYAPYLLSGSLNIQLNHAKTWTEAADLTAKLNELLSTPNHAANPVTDIRESENALREIMEPLREEFANHVQRILRESSRENAAADPNRCEQLHAVLRAPLSTATTRKELWTALQREEQRLHEKTTSRDQEDDQAGKGTAALPDSSRDAADLVRREIDVANLRGQVAIGLLKLSGSKVLQIPDSQRNLVPVTPAQLSTELIAAFEAARQRDDPGAFDEVAVRLGLCMKAYRKPDATAPNAGRSPD